MPWDPFSSIRVLRRRLRALPGSTSKISVRSTLCLMLLSCMPHRPIAILGGCRSTTPTRAGAPAPAAESSAHVRRQLGLRSPARRHAASGGRAAARRAHGLAWAAGGVLLEGLEELPAAHDGRQLLEDVVGRDLADRLPSLAAASSALPLALLALATASGMQACVRVCVGT